MAANTRPRVRLDNNGAKGASIATKAAKASTRMAATLNRLRTIRRTQHSSVQCSAVRDDTTTHVWRTQPCTRMCDHCDV